MEFQISLLDGIVSDIILLELCIGIHLINIDSICHLFFFYFNFGSSMP
jgi:hypothetical protein